MSKFITCIPVDVESIKAALPKGCYIHGTTFNPEKSRVELLWEHDAVRTPYNFPVEMPLEKLTAGVTPCPTPEVKPVDPKPRGRIRPRA